MTLTDTTPTVDEMVAATAAAVLDARAVLQECEDRLDDVKQQLAGVRDADGAALLDDLDAIDGLAERAATLEQKVRLTERAMAAQERRVMVAESAYLTAQADAHEVVVDAAREALDAHEARTRRLLDQLERHEGEYVTRLSVIQSASAAGAETIGMSWREPKSHCLSRALYVARLHVAVLREMAAGRDPQELLHQPGWRRPDYFADNHTVQEYPDCVWGPGALVPARLFVAKVQHQVVRVAELEQLAEALPEEIAAMERQLAESSWAGGSTLPGVTQGTVERRCARLEELDDEIAEARRALALITDG